RPRLAWSRPELVDGDRTAAARFRATASSGDEIERPGEGGSSARPLARYALTPRSRGPGRSHGRCQGSPPSRVRVGPARLGGGAGGERLQAVVCEGTPRMSGGFPRSGAGHLRRSQDDIDVYTI